MHQHPEVSPPARPFARAFALHEGQLFMQRLAGRSATGTPSVRESGDAAADGDWPDLDQRVRNVGEW